MLHKHYSPRAPVTLHAPGALTPEIIAAIPPDEAVLTVAPVPRATRSKKNPRARKNIFPLSRTGSLRDIARNLFAALRKLDAAGKDGRRWKKIHAGLVRATDDDDAGGLASAINDRLARASAK